MKTHEREETVCPLVDGVEQLASATECTGLIPAPVQTPEEGHNYAELYAIHEQKTAWKTEKDGKPKPRKED